MKKKNILITGGAGSIGKYLVDIFCKSNKYNVYVIDKKENPFISKKVFYFHEDLINITKKDIDIISPQIVIHLAASFQRSDENSQFLDINFNDNVLATHNLVKSIKYQKTVEKFIYASSYLVYEKDQYLNKRPRDPKLINEKSKIDMRNLIAASKIYGEKESDFLIKFNKKIDIIKLRIFRGYSTGCDSIISRWVRAILSNKIINVYNDLSSFDFIFAKDTALLIYDISNSSKKINSVLNVGSGSSIQIKEILKILKQKINKNVKISYEKGFIDLFENSLADIRKLKKYSNWKAKTSIESGIEKIINFEKAKIKFGLDNSKKKINILATSISNKSILLNELNNLEKKFPYVNIYGADQNSKIIGKYLVKNFFNIQNFELLNKNKIFNLLRKKNINIVIPTSDLELDFWSKIKGFLSKKGIFVAVSNNSAIRICGDKYKFFKHCIKLNLKTPILHSKIKKSKNKIIIKERFSADKNKAQILKNNEDLNKFKNPIFQEFYNLDEISIDCFVDIENEIIEFYPRNRFIILNGESAFTKFYKITNKQSKKIIKFLKSLNFYGHINIQAFVDKKSNDLIFFDCNPRFGGASSISLKNNLNSFYWYLCKYKKIKIEKNKFLINSKYKNQIIFKKFKVF